jgi:hypothetical protein
MVSDATKTAAKVNEEMIPLFQAFHMVKLQQMVNNSISDSIDKLRESADNVDTSASESGRDGLRDLVDWLDLLGEMIVRDTDLHCNP